MYIAPLMWNLFTDIKKKELAYFLYQKRLLANRTQLDVAIHLGFTSSQLVSRWERGKCFIPHQKWVELCQYCHIDTYEFRHILLEAIKESLRQKLP